MREPNLADLLHEIDTSVAVVGATDDPTKYGSVAYRDLKRKGFEVHPVNPYRSTVDGDQAFGSVSDLPKKPTIVNFVIPPQQVLTVLKECLELGYTDVWLQPGAESPDVLTFLQENEFNYLANSCIMVRSRAKR